MQFPILLKWELLPSGSYNLTIYAKSPMEQTGEFFNYLNATIILLALTIYVAFFTRKKFQRIKLQTEQYKKIKVLSLADYQLEVSPEFLAQMKN